VSRGVQHESALTVSISSLQQFILYSSMVVHNNNQPTFPFWSWPKPPYDRANAGEDEESSLPWMFCRLSLLRFMSYLPFLLVPAFDHRSRLSLSVAPPFGSECLTSFADVMAYYALCWLLLCGQAALRPPQSPRRRRADLLG